MFGDQVGGAGFTRTLAFSFLLVGTVICELQLDSEIGLAEHLNDFLKNVAALATDAYNVALDGGLHLHLAVLDLLDDLFGLLNR